VVAKQIHLNAFEMNCVGRLARVTIGSRRGKLLGGPSSATA
jgi:hypothetical protein